MEIDRRRFLSIGGAAVLTGALANLPRPAVADTAVGVVADERVRFRVITPSLIRMEYADDGRFDDEATMLAFDRNAGTAEFTTRIDGDDLVVETAQLSVRYRRGSGPFGDGNLDIRVRRGDDQVAAQPVWAAADYSPPLLGVGVAGYLAAAQKTTAPPPSDSLGGWLRSLDSLTGAVSLHEGLLTRRGWFFVDDSRSVLVPPDRDSFVRRAHSGVYQDGYLFGYGLDYRRALADYRALSGAAPLLPRNAFGVWFSRYHPYSADDYRDQLLPAFRAENVPLDVLMVDTQFKAPHDWNGWNWKPALFPDPPGFLRWAHDEGISVGLNTHPSIGGQDPKYPATVARSGPLPQIPLPRVFSLQTDPGAALDAHYGFDWSRPEHLDAYMALHDSFENDGADFWWLDWCCDETSAGPADGTLSGDGWINRNYALRPHVQVGRWLTLARAGGSWQDWAGDRPGPWGQHRSTIHFTGDAHSTWEMLDFEVKFTVAEGSTGLPYVSHDIGGFQGSLDDQLYVRWVQFATFAPILRLHSSPLGDIRRLPWEFDGKIRSTAADFLRRRGALIPHTYNLARETYDTGMPLVRGMYLDWPDADEAYEFTGQYMFGADLLVAPVTTPGDPATVRVWFPPGEWTDLCTGAAYQGPTVTELVVPLEQLPVFARAGSILPLQPAATPAADRLELRVFPGRNATYALYEDEGAGLGYQRGESAITRFTWDDAAGILTVGAAIGDYPGRPGMRAYTVRVEGRPAVHTAPRPTGTPQSIAVRPRADRRRE